MMLNSDCEESRTTQIWQAMPSIQSIVKLGTSLCDVDRRFALMARNSLDSSSQCVRETTSLVSKSLVVQQSFSVTSIRTKQKQIMFLSPWLIFCRTHSLPANMAQWTLPVLKSCFLYATPPIVIIRDPHNRPSDPRLIATLNTI